MFTYLSGSLCLDLAATLEAQHSRNPRELLTTGSDVTAWLDQAGLGAGIAVDSAGHERTIALREAIDRLCRRTGRAADRAFLNRIAANPPLVPYWTGRMIENLGGLREAHSTLARDAILLLSDSGTARIRECRHPGCSRLFHDVSRAGRRRWCCMKSCGTKTKSATYRTRLKERTGTTSDR
ncbi:CGNR zinc finger domain-containing protein [Amycolatopsis azurea]|uniref:CGNR zinc finger domain-containing protein n=1 Tax=Amycolatopsis azurea TaxID=36819 RepID=UPI0037FA85CD